MSEDDTIHTEQLTKGLARQVLDEGHIHVYILSEMTRETVDAWIDGCLAFMRECLEEEKPLLILQDLSARNIAQTPYSRERGSDITHSYPDLHGRIAFLLPNTPASQQIRLFIRSQPKQTRDREVFFTRETALKWLRQGLHHPPDVNDQT